MPLTKNKVKTLKLLLFPLGDLYLALRLTGLKRVIKLPEIFKSGDKVLGLAQVDGQDIIVLDIYWQIFGRSLATNKGFLVIVEADQQTYGIVVDTLPTIKDVPENELQPIPSDYRDRDPLGIADVMATINLTKTQTVTAFVLDSAQLLTIADAGSHAIIQAS
jgi:chemotaxis signal transduction protein